jgi:hypothetical protein
MNLPEVRVEVRVRCIIRENHPRRRAEMNGIPILEGHQKIAGLLYTGTKEENRWLYDDLRNILIGGIWMINKDNDFLVLDEEGKHWELWGTCRDVNGKNFIESIMEFFKLYKSTTERKEAGYRDYINSNEWI